MPRAFLVGRPTKSAAKSAEKPSIIFVRRFPRKRRPWIGLLNPSLSVPGVVLDTNVLLDWLVYCDPSCLALGRSIDAGEVHWLVAEPMRDEWNEVLARGVGAARAPDLAALADHWTRHARMLPAPLPSSRPHDCQCTDPDDQIFIDLALANGARWLLSRDRAVLKVAARARRRGLLIVTPAAWSLDDRS